MIRGMKMRMSSKVNTELLRSQLDHLHSEVDTTRRKANNARFRLLRLSEAAESLCRQAAKNVRMGNENDARELLRQKKKIMLALEKSKGRVELLDELAAKLSEAITIKEAQLVENVASDLEIDRNDAGSAVRIVSPPPGGEKPSENNNNINIKDANIDEEKESDNDETLAVVGSINGENTEPMMSSFKRSQSCIELLQDLDGRLEKIERELMSMSLLSTMVQDNEEVSNNPRVEQISKILEFTQNTRLRIFNYVQRMVATR